MGILVSTIVDESNKQINSEELNVDDTLNNTDANRKKQKSVITQQPIPSSGNVDPNKGALIDSAGGCVWCLDACCPCCRSDPSLCCCYCGENCDCDCGDCDCDCGDCDCGDCSCEGCDCGGCDCGDCF